jgi:thioredoxin reductase (NADPH)
MTKKLAIIGSGPAGLSAAINAASEGIDVTVFDRAALGGQFKESNSIQNYPGFANITGEALSAALISQANHFGVNFCAPFNVSGLLATDTKAIDVIGDDWQRISFDAVVLALGVQWRRLDIPGVAALVGHGVYYGAPPVAPKGERIVIVGAGNSAGQEAVKLAQIGNEVTVLVRRTLVAGMSKYLIDQLAGVPNIHVMEGVEINACSQNSDDSIRLSLTDDSKITADKVLIYIGAMPHTYWLRDTVALDPHGYIKTGVDLALADGRYQTSMAGVFAIGDARLGSCKRIGAAVGEGSSVIPQVHKFFATPATLERRD